MELGTGASIKQSAPTPRGSYSRGGRVGQRGGQRSGPKPPMEVVKTWAFDSVGTRKYALQIRKAGNGNPCLKIVEGVPQPDGTFRKFDLTFWSEDWPRLFEMVDTVRAFVAENNIRTPDGHKYEPGKRRGRSGAKARG
jgi:hypothetical protein